MSSRKRNRIEDIMEANAKLDATMGALQTVRVHDDQITSERFWDAVEDVEIALGKAMDICGDWLSQFHAKKRR